MDGNEMSAVLFFPENGESPRVVELAADDLEAMQALVEGYVEMLRLKDGLALFCNDDAISLEMEPNRVVPPALSGWFDPWRSTIRGPFYIGTQDESSLTDAQVKYVLHAFGERLEESGKVE